MAHTAQHLCTCYHSSHGITSAKCTAKAPCRALVVLSTPHTA
jgi:hypothetical protein